MKSYTRISGFHKCEKLPDFLRVKLNLIQILRKCKFYIKFWCFLNWLVGVHVFNLHLQGEMIQELQDYVSWGSRWQNSINIIRFTFNIFLISTKLISVWLDDPIHQYAQSFQGKDLNATDDTIETCINECNPSGAVDSSIFWNTYDPANYIELYPTSSRWRWQICILVCKI